MAEVGAALALQTAWSFYPSWIHGFHKGRGCIPAVQSMKAVSAAHGVSPASQPVKGFWFLFPQFLVLLRVGFAGTGLEGQNECVCIVHETLNYGPLQKVAWKFFLLLFPHTFPPPWRAGQCAVCPAEPKDSTAAPSCASKPPLPSKHGEPPVRRQVADGWEHRGTGRNMPVFPQQSCIQTLPGPDRFCTALSPSLHSAEKEQSSMSGWVPAPRERCPGSCWLLKGVAAYSPVPREQEGSAEEVMQEHRRTLAPSPVRTWRLNATNLLWFLN